MPVPFEEIEESLQELRRYFVDDVEPLLDQGSAGRMAAAIMVAIGHEQIARLWYGKPQGERSFAETLPQSWRPVAKSLYGALRDGLAHGFGTMTIDYAGELIVIGFSTGTLRPHRLTAVPWEDDEETNAVIFNTRRLLADLGRSFSQFEAELRADGALRDAFRRRGPRGRTKHVHDPAQVAAWRRLFNSAG